MRRDALVAVGLDVLHGILYAHHLLGVFLRDLQLRATIPFRERGKKRGGERRIFQVNSVGGKNLICFEETERGDELEKLGSVIFEVTWDVMERAGASNARTPRSKPPYVTFQDESLPRASPAHLANNRHIAPHASLSHLELLLQLHYELDRVEGIGIEVLDEGRIDFYGPFLTELLPHHVDHLVGMKMIKYERFSRGQPTQAPRFLQKVARLVLSRAAFSMDQIWWKK